MHVYVLYIPTPVEFFNQIFVAHTKIPVIS